MASFSQRRREFQDAQAFANANPQDRNAQRALADAAQALRESPEVGRARVEHRRQAQQTPTGRRR
ncbi:hypothetical protein AB0I89_24070 [Micromonospora sp. NPDC049801]|uniref:hypothetical protein n=1 Tax=unclassified Micromonospora TaxID=2617518 RepID=UPI0033C6D33C